MIDAISNVFKTPPGTSSDPTEPYRSASGGGVFTRTEQAAAGFGHQSSAHFERNDHPAD